jgi:chromosome segregation ATPase
MDEEQRWEAAKVTLTSRMQTYATEVEKLLASQLQLIQSLHARTGALLETKDAFTMDALTDLQKPLVDTVASIAELTAEKDQLPKNLANAQSVLADIKAKRDELYRRGAELDMLLESLEKRLKKIVNSQ